MAGYTIYELMDSEGNYSPEYGGTERINVAGTQFIKHDELSEADGIRTLNDAQTATLMATKEWLIAEVI